MTNTWRSQAAWLTLSLMLTGRACSAEPSREAASESAPGVVRNIKVLPDRAPDCSSLKNIVESVTRGCRTNDEKAIAIYNFMRMTHYHHAYPGEPQPIPALKEINCYGWSLCGGLHATESALWHALGWEWRFIGWPGHTTVEARYDGRWHYLDVFLKFYTWMPDPRKPGARTIAGEEDIAANPRGLLKDAFVFDRARKVVYARDNPLQTPDGKVSWMAPAFLVCGDDLAGVEHGVRHRNRAGSPEEWGGIQHGDGGYSAEVSLAPGYALTSTWDRKDGAWYWCAGDHCPGHTCGDKEIRNSPEKGLVAEPYLGRGWVRETYGSGNLSFTPALTDSNCLKSFLAVNNVRAAPGKLVALEAGKPASVTLLLQSPYILTQASGSAEGCSKLEVSIDGGKTWKEADLKDFGAAVKGRLSALVRLSFGESLKDIRISATVQNNPFALPFLSPGKNKVRVSVDDPAALGENRLVVTYAYRVGARNRSYEAMVKEGKEIARAHNAHWEETPTVVQKEFTAKDLPGQFEIDIPTPQGKFPVYPRMLFVRREVLAQGEKPLPLPTDAQPPTRAHGNELKTLPSPLSTGIREAGSTEAQ